MVDRDPAPDVGRPGQASWQLVPTIVQSLLDRAPCDLGDGEDVNAARPLVMEEVRHHFRPEFLNRIDEIILFKRLGRAAMDDIVRIQLQRVEKMLADRRMSISLDPSALHWLGERGYDPVYGARPLKRVIQKELMDPIARKLLAGEMADGSVIEVSADADGLVIGKARVH